jgi:hypothetical protein
LQTWPRNHGKSHLGEAESSATMASGKPPLTHNLPMKRVTGEKFSSSCRCGVTPTKSHFMLPNLSDNDAVFRYGTFGMQKDD